MKLMFVHPSADLYGASRSLLRLSTRLVMDGHGVVAVLPFDGPLVSVLREAGVDVRLDMDMPVFTRHGFRSVAGWLRLMKITVRSGMRCRTWIREFRPDIVHSNDANMVPICGLIGCILGARHVWHIRESFAEFPGLWRLHQHVMYACADVILAVSDAIAGQFKGRARGVVLTIHNGIPQCELVQPNQEEVHKFKKMFGLENALLIGVVGRIKILRKGQETFVKAAGLVASKWPGVRFLLIGSPFPGNEAHLDRVREAAQAAGVANQVVYTGDVDNIKAAIEALDIVVLSSGQPEPFAGIVIEAMGLSKPVIGTGIGGTVEQIDDGRSGLLVPPGDAVKMASAMETLLSNSELRNCMGRAARARYLALFEFEMFYKKIYGVYMKLLKDKK